MKTWYKLYKPVVDALAILLLLAVMGVGGCVSSLSELDKLGEKTKYDATLVEAYSTYQNCGHKGRSQCEVFMGRLVLDQGGQIEKELNGFLYHSFIKNGEKDERAVVTLTPRDFGKRPTLTSFILVGVGTLSIIGLFFMLIFTLTELPDIYKEYKRSLRYVR